jgi:hypothetical protein
MFRLEDPTTGSKGNAAVLIGHRPHKVLEVIPAAPKQCRSSTGIRSIEPEIVERPSVRFELPCTVDPAGL